jgi:hypothetical protein
MGLKSCVLNYIMMAYYYFWHYLDIIFHSDVRNYKRVGLCILRTLYSVSEHTILA